MFVFNEFLAINLKYNFILKIAYFRLVKTFY